MGTEPRRSTTAARDARPADNGSGAPRPDGLGEGADLDDLDDLDQQTAATVLHRVLARAAQSFLVNDAPGGVGGDELLGRVHPADWGDPHENGAGPWRRLSSVERVHQSRVAMRRIRSNLRTFRLLVDPAWGTAVRAELSWYTDELGRSRDLHVMRERLAVAGPLVTGEERIQPVLARIDEAIREREEAAEEARLGRRHDALVDELVGIWHGPPFTPKSDQPAADVLPPQLTRPWRDVREAARRAKRSGAHEDLHRLRIRLKNLRYGAETVALVSGGPARKTAKAAEALQSRLGDLHDADVAVAWLHRLADGQPELADVARELVLVGEAEAAVAKKGWRKELKEVERRWRRWRG